jgi:hypothetical protein
MKKTLRSIFGSIFVLPFVISTKLLSVFLGQQRAIKIIGPIVTKIVKPLIKFLWVPNISSPEDFDSFSERMKKNFWIWKQLFDFKISEESKDVFKLHLTNCPFCEAFNNFGIPELNEYFCEGDWAVAKDNSDKWIFERNHQIGTGDSFCDHTYKRIQQ